MSPENSTKHPVKSDSPESDDGELVSRVKNPESSVIRESYSYRGPIPDPAMLEKYEQIHPGAIKWILNASEEERKHRHKMEEFATKNHFGDIGRGQWFAFLTVALTMAVAAYLAHLEQGWPAGILGSVGLLGLVYVFVQGRKDSKESGSAGINIDNSD